MSKVLGANFTLVASVASFDPLQGYQLLQRYEGTQESLLSLAGAFRLQGVKADVSTDNGKSVLSCVFGGSASQIISGGEGSGDPVDRYTLNDEFSEQSIWNNPAVITEANAAGNIAGYRQFIEEAADNETPLAYDESVRPIAWKVYRALVRGVDKYEVHSPTLTRTRSIPVNSTQRLIVADMDTVWTTTALIRVFELPLAISSRLPSNPATITDAVWGWKLQKNTSEYVLAASKIEEQKEWVFSAWPDFLYTFVLT